MKKTLLCLIFICLMLGGCANKMPVALKTADIENTDTVLSEDISSENNVNSEEDVSTITPSSIQNSVSNKSSSSVASSSNKSSSSKSPSLSDNSVSSGTPSSETPSAPPSGTIENSELLKKHNLEISVYAWNDYMPYMVAPGETPPPSPRPHFIVRFTSTQSKNIPTINVWAKITSGKNTLDIMLTCDGNSPEYNFETFRAGTAQGLKLESETLTAIVTFVIGDEKQTLTFNPTVETTH